MRIRAGQRFWPRSGRRRGELVVCAVGEDGIVRARRLDGSGRRVRVTATRLAALRPDGQGRYYQFVTWAPRRYQTRAIVIRIDSVEAILVLPEWHPARPVRVPARLVPEGARHPDAWLSLRADLSVGAAGALNLSSLRHCAKPALGPCTLAIGRPVR